jgi:hypothetical protein
MSTQPASEQHWAVSSVHSVATQTSQRSPAFRHWVPPPVPELATELETEVLDATVVDVVAPPPFPVVVAPPPLPVVELAPPLPVVELAPPVPLGCPELVCPDPPLPSPSPSTTQPTRANTVTSEQYPR